VSSNAESSLRRVCELVESTAPAYGDAFVWLDPDHGGVPELGAAMEGVDRLFELANVRALDAGEGGCVSARLRIFADLRIRYRDRGSRMGLAVQQAEDVRLLRDAIMFTPSAWNYSTTGLTSVLFGEATGPEPLGADDSVEPPVHEAITIPLTLEVDP